MVATDTHNTKNNIVIPHFIKDQMIVLWIRSLINGFRMREIQPAAMEDIYKFNGQIFDDVNSKLCANVHISSDNEGIYNIKLHAKLEYYLGHSNLK